METEKARVRLILVSGDAVEFDLAAQLAAELPKEISLREQRTGNPFYKIEGQDGAVRHVRARDVSVIDVCPVPEPDPALEAKERVAQMYLEAHAEYLRERSFEGHTEEHFKWVQLVPQEVEMWASLGNPVTQDEFHWLCERRGFNVEQQDFLRAYLELAGLSALDPVQPLEPQPADVTEPLLLPEGAPVDAEQPAVGPAATETPATEAPAPEQPAQEEPASEAPEGPKAPRGGRRD